MTTPTSTSSTEHAPRQNQRRPIGGRTPLSSRSSNVRMVASQLTSPATATFASPKMASNDPNKRPPTGRAGAYPAALPRVKTGPFVTPRLATSNSSPDTSRRPAGSARSVAGTPKDDATPPAKPFLNSNITPRSGARMAKVGSASTTPNGTPAGTPTSSRPASMVATRDVFSDYSASAPGIGISGVSLQSHSRAGSIVGDVAGAPNALRSTSPDRSATVNTQSPPMFFHASDARAAPPKPAVPASAQSKNAGFFYANGQSEVDASPTPASRSQSAVQPRPKFYHASTTPESTRMQQTPSPAQRSSPNVPVFSPPVRQTPARSTSPLKEFENAEQPRPRRPSKAYSELKTGQAQARPLSAESPLEITQHTTPRTPAQGLQHRKTSSNTSCEALSPTQQALAALDSTSITSDPRISDASSSFLIEPEPLVPLPGSLASLSEPFTQPSTLTSISDPQLAKVAPPTSPLISPTHSSIAAVSSAADPPSKLEQANTLAAQARRERKVLDLEISNSSLLAINRTLERELRKQKAELRRFKRLTSSGRISLPAVSSRATSGAFSIADTDTTGLDPLSEAEDEDEDDALSDASDISSSTGSSPSSTTHSPRSAALQREKDSRRLQLDLERHQALLADSQRMNQSLKRCLTWTEELIADGRRALAYTVRVSEVRVGGRVLAEDEVPDGVEFEQRRGLLSPGHNGERGPVVWPGDAAGERGGQVDGLVAGEAAGETTGGPGFEAEGVDLAASPLGGSAAPAQTHAQTEALPI